MATTKLNNWLTVSSSDPNVQRRAKLLNILIAGVFVLAVSAIVVTIILGIINQSLGDVDVVEKTVAPAILMIVALVIVYATNRFWSTSIASVLFLAMLTTILVFSAPPYESVWGRNMIMFALPIVMSSVIMKPRSSFFVAIIITIIFVGLSNANNFSLNFVGVLVYFAIALVSWLSARSLEDALSELTEINIDLDAKVDDRTKELVLANDQLELARDNAVAANKYKTELTARVSHELRSPLGAILGYSEMLMRGNFGETNKKQREKLQTIITTTNNLSGLINDILDESKLAAGKIELNLAWFSVQETIDYVQELTSVLIKDKPITLRNNIPEEFPAMLYGDSERIKQIMINLISNAIKYTDAGHVLCNLFLSGDTWKFSVSDTGIGIPVLAIPNIFDSFSQVDGSKTRSHEGFGLGLSIVNQLVVLMDGEIEVQSVENEGSVFTVAFPLLNPDVE